ncbi:MAG: hypothetical protein L3J71_03805 [Victivallaceae bacterium]|nr:hypothetical protein [Victivallaceae bacterium]
MNNQLKELDSELVEFKSGDGMVYVSPGLQGRIFCGIDEMMIHQFDAELASAPDPIEFNNIGGNSLWPAPEGGRFAFNYPPNSDEWLVQPAINSQCLSIVEQHESSVIIGKKIELLNRNNCRAELLLRREITVNEIDLAGFDLQGVAYSTQDSFSALGEYPVDDFLLASWSLEQFPGGEGIVAFGKVGGKAADCINDDFYGDAGTRLSFDDNMFAFRLGGVERLQIGIKRSSQPELIGAYDPARSLLMIRETPLIEGKYINIADNEQPDGPFSAEDVFSIFNGGELGFFELETIAPMAVENGLCAGSQLESKTTILRGEREPLAQYLKSKFNINMDLLKELGRPA